MVDDELLSGWDRERYEGPGADYKAAQADAWLGKCRRTVALERRLERIARMQLDMADGLKALDYSTDKVDSSPSPDAVPNAAIRHMEIGASLKALADDAAARVARAQEAIMALDDLDEADALLGYYIEGESWERLSADKPCSYRTMMRIRKRALVNLYDGDLIPHTERDPRPPAF